MNEQLHKLMLEAGYAAPELATRAQQLAHSLILLCADIAVQHPYYAQWEIEKLLSP